MLINGKNYCCGCMKMIPQGMEKCSCGFEENGYQNPQNCLPVGTILEGGYVVGRVLGAGGFGITYMGLDVDLDLRVAIKEFYMNAIVNRDVSVSNDVITTEGRERTVFDDNKEKFIEEGKALAKLQSEPGVVAVHRYIQQNNTAYIIMEFLEGEDLKHVLKRNGNMSDKEMVQTLLPVLHSLQKVHELGIIHRDISPDNIMLTKSGNVKLLDFGAARSTDSDKSMTVMLKHGYAPWEQYLPHGRSQGTWTDVYALAATMYMCLTGKVPEAAGERLENFRKGVDTPSPTELGADCCKSVSNVIMKGLAVRAEDRFKTVKELREALERAVAGENIEYPKPVFKAEEKKTEVTKEEAKPEKKKSSVPIWFVLLIAVAVIALVAMVVVLLLNKNGTDSDSGSISDIFTEEGLGHDDDYVYHEEEEKGMGYEEVFLGLCQNGPIAWYVLDEADDKLFLFAKDAVDMRSYHDADGPVTWETSSIRYWLNHEFLELCFSDEERSAIAYTHLKASDCALNGTSGGNDTDDYIFLLTADEVDKYLSSVEKKTKPISYYEEENYLSFALRTQGKSESQITAVGSDGVVSPAYTSHMSMNGIRPAMWVDKSMLGGLDLSESIYGSGKLYDMKASQVMPGQLYQLGVNTKGLMGIPFSGNKIAWEVLKVENGKAFVISTRVFEKIPYGSKGGSGTWEDSSIRKWLNEDFIEETFTEEEKAAIVPATIATYGKINNSSGTYYSEDSVFLLSQEELNTYFFVLDWFINPKNDTTSSRSGNSLLRDFYISGGENYAFNVDKEHLDAVTKVDTIRQDMTHTLLRPAMWVQLK